MCFFAQLCREKCFKRTHGTENPTEPGATQAAQVFFCLDIAPKKHVKKNLQKNRINDTVQRVLDKLCEVLEEVRMKFNVERKVMGREHENKRKKLCIFALDSERKNFLVSRVSCDHLISLVLEMNNIKHEDHATVGPRIRSSFRF